MEYGVPFYSGIEKESCYRKLFAYQVNLCKEGSRMEGTLNFDSDDFRGTLLTQIMLHKLTQSL